MFQTLPEETFVKICGITCPEAAEQCLRAGANAIGINLYPKSRRFHPLEQARQWLGQFTGVGFPAKVALFVNAPLDEIRAAADSGLFDAIQLHGNESVEFCSSVKSLGLPLIRVLVLRTADDFSEIVGHPADAFILDAYAPDVFGGTGRLSDWQLAAEAVRRFPDRFFILGGGLTPENVLAALDQVRPSGVDVASGVESAPGVKDGEKIREFVAGIRRATNSRLFP